MRKHIYILIILSAITCVLSGLLWSWYYFPENAIGGSSFYNPFIALAASKWYTFLNIPMPATTFCLHLYIIFILLVADYAGGRYPLISISLIIPISTVILLLNVICILLIATSISSFHYFLIILFVANVLVFAICIWLYLEISNKGYRSMPGIIINIFADPGDNPDRKAAIAYSTLFVVFLVATTISIAHIVDIKNPPLKVSENQMQMFLENYDSTPTETLDLPETNLHFGSYDADITLVVFTDFLCSSCDRFYQTQRYLASRFGNKINFLMYHFPLDTSCNKYMDETLYDNSCLASQTVQTAADMGILDTFMSVYVKNHNDIAYNYNLDKVQEILRKVKISFPKKKEFEDILTSGKSESVIKAHIEAAERLKIDGTPTVFINGKRFPNVPPKEMLEELIDRELKKI